MEPERLMYREKDVPTGEYVVIRDESKKIVVTDRKGMEEEILRGGVDYISKEGILDGLEIEVYRAKLLIEASREKGFVVGNKEITKFLGKETKDDSPSRNAVAKARKNIAKRMGYKSGW